VIQLAWLSKKSPNVAQSSTNSESKDDQETTIFANEYKEYLQLKAAQHASSSAAVAPTGNSKVCLSHSPPLGCVLDSGASDHVTGNSSIFFLNSLHLNIHIISPLLMGLKFKLQMLDKFHLFLHSL